MPKKLLRCVKKVEVKNPDINAWGICIKSTGLKPHKKMTEFEKAFSNKGGKNIKG